MTRLYKSWPFKIPGMALHINMLITPVNTYLVTFAILLISNFTKVPCFMAGVYIHIPFCRKACNYCNFHFSTSPAHRSELVSAILQEIDLRKNYLSEPVSTIYFGGGTPSILPT